MTTWLLIIGFFGAYEHMEPIIIEKPTYDECIACCHALIWAIRQYDKTKSDAQ